MPIRHLSADANRQLIRTEIQVGAEKLGVIHTEMVLMYKAGWNHCRHVCRDTVQGLNSRELIGCGDEEKPAKETKKEQSVS